MDENTYECGKCGKVIRATSLPDCCGRKMTVVKLPPCTSAASAEHSRPMEDEEPCDDSRGG
ncbi:MAG: hypothetical protein PHU53_03105 [Thermoplasmata archaeon]|nr:hypothetical protein [Thermoplasmata archaeon]